MSQFVYSETARGSLVAAEDPLGAFTSYQYDAVSHLVRRTDARNHITSYTVDALGRTAGVLYSDAARVTNTFDAAGRQTEMQDALGDTLYGYDNANRQTSVLYPTRTSRSDGIALTYVYDGVSNRTSMVSPGDARTTYAYDAQERLSGILNPYNEQTTIAYDALDRESKKTLANGVTADHTYDQAGRVTVLANAKSDGSARTGSRSEVSIYTATYDAIGDRLTVMEFDGVQVTYTYDATSQLTQEQRSGANAYDLSYQYGPTGNRLVKTDSGALTTYTYNSADELLLVQPPTGQPTTMAYDSNGNLALENAGGSLTTYTWDDENRLAALAEPASGLSTFAYAPNGLRQKKETSAGTSLFTWDGQNVLLETDASLITKARFTNFPGIWGGLTSMHRSGASSFFAFDQQSSTRELLTAAEGVSDTYLYTAFGEEIATSGTTENPLRYVGEFGYWRDTADREYAFAGYYDPNVARWLSSPSALLRNALEGTSDFGGRSVQHYPNGSWPIAYVSEAVGVTLEGKISMQLKPIASEARRPKSGSRSSGQPYSVGDRNSTDSRSTICSTVCTGGKPESDCFKDCNKDFHDHLKDCHKDYNKCVEKCLKESAIFWPVCIYYKCQSEFIICGWKAYAHYEVCLAKCVGKWICKAL